VGLETVLKIVKESAVHNLTKTLVTVSLLIPTSAYSLGIGEIKLHSALNQNLDAEIALLISPNEKIANLNIKLASPEKFDEAGIPWGYFLSKIKFKPVSRKDGSKFIQLSSQETLREPFLDFLLEVSWNKGRLFREFTVLVDPPVAYTQPVIPVIDSPAPAIKGQQPTNVSPGSKNKNQQTGIVAQYGPTKRTDSLWKVAEKTNAYQDVSVEQMIMAIYQANPKSFYKKNVNALMAGKTLVIPDRKSIIQLSQPEALAAFRQQTQAWKQLSTPSANLVKRTRGSSQLELEAPEEADISESTLVGSSPDTADNTEHKQTNGIASTEALALQARMERLEQQLGMLQKMLAIKDEKIAALQNRPQQIAVPDHTHISSETSQQPADNVAVKHTDTPPPPHQQSQKNSQSQVNTTTQPSVQTVPPPSAANAPIQSAPPPVDNNDSNLLNMGLVGVGVGILALLGLFLWRKRNEEEIDEESMFATASEISLPDSASEDVSIPITDDSAYDVGTVGESSFLSEFTPSEFDSFDSDQNEVDPISEADVYLAYGRYQQAEDLMRQAIEDQPDRDECKLKLLEIFYASENKEAFAAYATELANADKNTDQDFWDKVVEMGVELLPSSALFSSQAGGTTETVTESDDNLTETLEADQENLTDLPVNHEKEDLPQTDELDFDLSVFNLDQPDEKADEINKESVADDKTTALADEIESFDFDMPTEDVDKAEVENDPVGIVDLSNEPDDSTESLDSFDFSSISSETEEKTDTNILQQSIEKEDSLDSFDFDFDFETPPTLDKANDNDDEVVDIGVSDLTDMDELETQIDLAKAYIDMGDPDAAKEIAQIVLEKGNEEQKQVAQTLLDSL